jgi:glycosyltransferase involved in cell wall biosynthesis
MFSVIIPLFNKSAYIERCLQSVYNQTYKNYEVIVINDGSTDNGPDKVKRMINGHSVVINEQLIVGLPERIKSQKNEQLKGKTGEREVIGNKDTTRNIDIRLINQRNLGVSATRNVGVSEARFDYLAFLDADDWWETNYLEEMKKLISEYSEKGIYACSYYIVKNGKKRIANIGIGSDFIKGEIDYFKVYGKTLCMPVWTGATIVNRRIFNLFNGFKPQITLGEDFDLWVRIALQYPVVLLNKPLSNYNQDVVYTNRAVGKLHNPINHILWNLNYLESEEKCKPELKNLIDRLRIYGLIPYYMSKAYRSKAITELQKVDWSHYNSSHLVLKYKIPLPVIKIYYTLKKIGSFSKQFLLRHVYQLSVKH